MTEEKKTIDLPTFVMTAPEMAENRRSYKKYIIIAVTAVVTVAVILSAILVGVYMFSESQKAIVKITYSRGDNWKEEVTSDENTNIVQYHINGDSYEAWIFNDFNRDLQVTKVQSSIGTNCYVTPLNRTTASDPSKIAPLAGKSLTAKNATYSVTYRSGNTPIFDSSFLPKSAKDACKEISTYWLYPSCSNSAEPNKGADRTARRAADIYIIVTDRGVIIIIT